MAIFVFPPVSLSISGNASEATLLLVEQNTEDTVTELQDVNTELDAHTVELQAINTELSEIEAGIPASLGQQTMANSMPVVIASNQSAVPISAASLPLPTGAATEATLLSLNGKVTTVNTNSVIITGALPTGDNNIGNVDVVSSVLPADAATETTLQNIDSNINSIANSGIPANVPEWSQSTSLIDTSSSNIPASASNPLQVIASLTSGCKIIQSVEDIGEFIGVYQGPALSEQLVGVLPLGGGELNVSLSAGTRVSLRNMKNATISTGFIVLNFLL